MGTYESIRDKMIGYFTDEAFWANLLFGFIKIVVIYIVGKLLVRVLNKMITHMIVERERQPFKFDQRRTKTVGKLINNVMTYTVNFIIIMLILSQMNFDLAPLLAGAGVLGLAIGFGAQSLVKDVITGFFIIFEDQFAVGDVIQTKTFKGTVEEIGLRVTRIRSWTGEVHIIPNGSITEVTNFSTHNSLAVVDVYVAYESNLEQAMSIIRDAMQEMHTRHEEIVKTPEVLGLQALGATDATIRVTAECMPNSSGAASRIINEEIKKRLDAEGVKFRTS